MLDLLKEETERIDSRFLEPACGSGNFLVPVLKRKLAAVECKYAENIKLGSTLSVCVWFVAKNKHDGKRRAVSELELALAA